MVMVFTPIDNEMAADVALDATNTPFTLMGAEGSVAVGRIVMDETVVNTNTL